MSKVVLGIDPGPRESSLVWWDGEKVVKYQDLPNDKACVVVTHDRFNDDAACEWVESFGMAVGKEVFETVFAVGVFFGSEPCLRLVPRRDVKLHLCGSARAKDANIRQALIDRFGPVGTKKNPGPLFGISKHRWAALAVAVTAFDLERTEHEAFFHQQREEVME